jgi:hypothetical protein
VLVVTVFTVGVTMSYFFFGSITNGGNFYVKD